MISFDLKCADGHVFEIWFRSSADYETQRKAGLINCPTCGDQSVDKAAMAPAVAAKGSQRRAPLPQAEGQFMTPPGGEQPREDIRALVHALAEAQARALKDSQWVGDQFAEQARAMHYGEKEMAVIHGTADLREARAMLEEGLAVAPLLVPVVPPDQAN